MFDFDIDYLFEGEQADAYKAKKEQEKREQEKSYDKYNPDYGNRADHGQGYKAPNTKTHKDYMKAEYGTARGATKQEKDNSERRYEANKTADEEIERREIGRQRPEGERRNFDDGRPNPYRQVTNNKYYGKKYDGKYASYGNERNKDQTAAADALDRHNRRHPSKESMLEDLMENDIHFLDIMNEDI